MSSLTDALKGRVKPVGSWALNRLNLARDTRAVKQFDFGPTEIQENLDLMTKYAANPPKIQTINWLVPNVKHPLFAGVYTILRFADYFAREKKIQNRVIFYGGEKGNLANLKEKIGASFPSLTNGISEVPNPEPERFPTSDISVATCWDSAYLLLKARNTKGKFYFVQDFEPLFYPAGATYGLVEATYRMGYWAIANTNGLGSFIRETYGMTVKSFQPQVDINVYHPAANRSSSPIKVFFYGRPRNPRNGFILGVEALKRVKAEFQQEVEIVSAGGHWDPSEFNAKDSIQNLGVLKSIEEVAALYRSCHIGLAFMFTKHPSYQPMEMMASGMAVVANENSAFHDLLVSGENSMVVEPTVSSVAQAISRLVRDAELRKTLATNALKTAASSTWSKEIEGVYDFLVRPPRMS